MSPQFIFSQASIFQCFSPSLTISGYNLHGNGIYILCTYTYFFFSMIVDLPSSSSSSFSLPFFVFCLIHTQLHFSVKKIKKKTKKTKKREKAVPPVDD